MANTLILISIFVVRLGGIGLLFVINPIVAMSINFILDCVDGPIYKYRLKVPSVRAQYYDKVLDYLYYVGLIVYVFVRGLVVWPLLLILFLFRTVGEFIFFVKGNRRVFVYFPNFFEFFVLGFLIVDAINPNYLTPELNWIVLLFMLITIFRIWNEEFLHKSNKTFFRLFWLPLFRLLKSRLAKKIR